MRTGLMLLIVMLAGCSEPVTEAADVEPDEAPPLEPILVDALRSASVAWQGLTKEGFWVCDSQDATGTCAAGQQIQPDGQFATTFTVVNLTALYLNMTWTPADATQTGMVFALYDANGATLASAAGQSPLAIDLDMAPTDGTLTLMAWPQGKTATNPSVFVDVTRQAFTVTGALISTDQVWVMPDAA